MLVGMLVLIPLNLHSEDTINRKKTSSRHFSIVFQSSKRNVCDEEIRYILKFYHKKDKNATNATNKICAVYGPNEVSIRIVQMWFKLFKSGNFCLKDEVRSGCPVTDKISAIFEKVEQDRHICSYDIAEKLDHKIVLRHEHLGTRKNSTFGVPHDLTERNLM